MALSTLRMALRVYAFGVFGVFLLGAPWTSLWSQAMAVWVPERYLPFILSGWARGMVTALGLLDLIVAAQMASELWT